MSHQIRSALVLAAALCALSTSALAQSSYKFVELKPLAADVGKNINLRPVAVNNSGQVVGAVFKQTGSYFKLLQFRFEPVFSDVPTSWSAAGAATELKRPSMPSTAGKYDFAVRGLNNTGQLVGLAVTKTIQGPVTWKQGTPSALSTLTGQANAVNDQGVVAGQVLANQAIDVNSASWYWHTHAVLWRGVQMEDLHPMVQAALPRFTYSAADDVAADGRVSITATTADTDEKACLVAQNGLIQALPVPEGFSCRQARFWPGDRITALLDKRCLEIPCTGQTRIGMWLHGQPIEAPTTAQLIAKPVTGLPTGLTPSAVLDISDNGRMLVLIEGAAPSFPPRYGVLTPQP